MKTIGIHTPETTTRYYNELTSLGFEVDNVSYKNDEVDSFEIGRFMIMLPSEEYPTFSIFPSDEYGFGEKSVNPIVDTLDEVVSFLKANI